MLFRSANNSYNNYLRLSIELEQQIFNTEAELQKIKESKREEQKALNRLQIEDTFGDINTWGNSLVRALEGYRICGIYGAVGGFINGIDVSAVAEWINNKMNSNVQLKLQLNMSISEKEKRLKELESQSKGNKALLKSYSDEMKKLKEEMNNG